MSAGRTDTHIYTQKTRGGAAPTFWDCVLVRIGHSLMVNTRGSTSEFCKNFGVVVESRYRDVEVNETAEYERYTPKTSSVGSPSLSVRQLIDLY